ncbi:MAG: M28 family metallopeptidase [Chitinophagaceae bacterium]|jgi:hypothetical protein
MNKKHFIICSILFLLTSYSASSQILQEVKQHLSILCSDSLAGRGYVDDGVNKAANYIESQFEKLKMRKYGKSYTQSYAFPVNTHPFPIRCNMDNQSMRAGIDYLVEAGSPSIQGTFRLLHFNPTDSLDRILMFKKLVQGIEPDHAIVLHKGSKFKKMVLDTLKSMNQRIKLLVVTEEKKMTHTVATELEPLASIIFMDSVIQNKEVLNIQAPNHFIKAFECKNVAAYVKGKNTQETIVFTAHYDHLGKMGNEAIFKGGSDNASGVSMLLYLAKYFTEHKPRCNVAFILFSGEEAGLIGSSFYTQNPMFPLRQIKCVVNIDIMGNAEKGITVVNGESCRKEFDLLQNINKEKNYLPEVKIRGQAAISDHYMFSESGVPAIFIYSNGGQGYYHDVFDTAENLMLTRFEEVAALLIDFAFKI